MSTLRLAFAGTPDFAARHLDALIHSPHDLQAVLTQPDRPAGRGKKDRASPVKVLAETHDLPLLQPASLRDPEAVAEIQELNLDALIVVAYGLILPQSVLDLPRCGCLNVHGSLLPRWRGAAPIQRAIEAGDAESGVTIMLMDAGLDTGPMLAKGLCPITAHTSSADLYEELATIGPSLLLEVLDDLPALLSAATVQEDDEACYAAKISKDEALIDWTQPAAVVARRIRAFNPAPGCYSFLDGQRVKVWAAQSATSPSTVPPGTILKSSEHGIAVRCGDGAVILERLQMAGSKAMDARDLLRGHGALFAAGNHFSAEAPA
ncbi:methionyl-tRNA formyltransferase [Congregibacter litoralis]|uniref:Methionyl-tRNA formyltransferase n=1 Tax=Congregibacter litoralis KT71 TaxID=314285 RepID=A4A935_9GAMM|nr:methionyl-tRNA formyltransferase [Congregibacter litoralis]EAQ97577.1 methionyl-tRNA formyltransferase [Congregibacter litoralis KT71]